MSEWIGGLLLAGALGIWVSGWEPLAGDDKAKATGMQRGPNGTMIWVGGLQGGK